MPSVLLTGFAPFGGEAVNPSERLVRALAAEPPPGLDLRPCILPVSYAAADEALRAALAGGPADFVIGTGLAGGRTALSVERVAINVDDAVAADNDGARRVDAPVVPGGPAAYFATVPIKAMAAALRDAGVPALVSQSAGTFLCNHVFYFACHLAAATRGRTRVGFIHVPFLPEQATHHPGAPSMTLATMRRGLDAALGALLRDGPDLRIAEGAVS